MKSLILALVTVAATGTCNVVATAFITPTLTMIPYEEALLYMRQQEQHENNES